MSEESSNRVDPIADFRRVLEWTELYCADTLAFREVVRCHSDGNWVLGLRWVDEWKAAHARLESCERRMGGGSERTNEILARNIRDDAQIQTVQDWQRLTEARLRACLILSGWGKVLKSDQVGFPPTAEENAKLRATLQSLSELTACWINDFATWEPVFK